MDTNINTAITSFINLNGQMSPESGVAEATQESQTAPAPKTTPKAEVKRPELVPEKAKHLYTNDWEVQVYVARCSDRKHLTYYFYVVGQDGEVSDPIVKPLSKLTSASGFDFLLDMEGGFDKSDVDNIRVAFNNALEGMPTVRVDTRTPMAEIYGTLCEIIKSQAKAAQDDPKSGGPYAARVLAEDNGSTYGNFLTEDFKQLVAEKVGNEDWFKWTALSIKQELKRLGKLRYNDTRYDYALTENVRAISIKLPEGWCLSDD